MDTNTTPIINGEAVSPSDMVAIAHGIVRLRSSVCSMVNAQKEVVRCTGTGHDALLQREKRRAEKFAHDIDNFSRRLWLLGMSVDYVAELTADIDTCIPDNIECRCEWCS